MSDVGTIVKVEAGFPIYSKFLDRWFTAETRIRQGETKSDAIIRLEKELNDTADKLRSEVNKRDPPLQPEEVMYTPGPPPVINIQDEKSADVKGDMLNAIQTAPTLEELKTYKTIASADKSKDQTIYNAYCSRLKELSV